MSNFGETEWDGLNKKFTVYIIINTATDKAYIGYTNNFERRCMEHFSDEYRGLKSSRKKQLYIDMGELGDDMFIMSPLEEEIDTKVEAKIKESEWIKKIDKAGIAIYNINKNYRPDKKKIRSGPRNTYCVSCERFRPASAMRFIFENSKFRSMSGKGGVCNNCLPIKLMEKHGYKKIKKAAQ